MGSGKPMSNSTGLFPARKRRGVWWRDHSPSLVVETLLLAQAVWVVFIGHAVGLPAGRPTASRSPAGRLEFWQWWSFELVNSHVADTSGVLLIVLLTKWFYERGSDE